MKRVRTWFVGVAVSVSLFLSACSEIPVSESVSQSTSESSHTSRESQDYSAAASDGVLSSDGQQQTIPDLSQNPFSIDEIVPYSGQPYIAVNNNIPYFSHEDLPSESFESYSELDRLGRCGPAYALIGTDVMPTEERGNIGQIKPTGWHTVKYDCVDGNYLYNRCHLIGYQLAGENANEKNLITGTRYLNVQGMLPFENMVADFIIETENHVLYRVTPIFEGDNLLADGVLIEAESIEDNGNGILFCVFVYNVQPDIIIDYATGESFFDPSKQTPEPTQEPTPTPTPQPTVAPTPIPTPVPTPEPTVVPTVQPTDPPQETPQGTTYILNTNTKKFHYPSCRSVKQMKDKNKQEYTGTRDEVISKGYDPCKNCNP